jgi:hypothetical protein
VRGRRRWDQWLKLEPAGLSRRGRYGRERVSRCVRNCRGTLRSANRRLRVLCYARSMCASQARSERRGRRDCGASRIPWTRHKFESVLTRFGAARVELANRKISARTFPRRDFFKDAGRSTRGCHRRRVQRAVRSREPTGRTRQPFVRELAFRAAARRDLRTPVDELGARMVSRGWQQVTLLLLNRH